MKKYIGTEQDLLNSGFRRDDVFPTLFAKDYENEEIDCVFIDLDELCVYYTTYGKKSCERLFYVIKDTWEQELMNDDTTNYIQDLIDAGLVEEIDL